MKFSEKLMRTCLLKPLPFLAYKAHSLSFCSQEANRNDKSSLVVPQTEKEVRRPEIIILTAL